MEPILELLKHPKYQAVVSRPQLTIPELRVWYSEQFTLSRRCLFVWHSMMLHPDGTVSPCQFITAPLGSVREESVTKIWNGDGYRQLRRELKRGLTPACSRCCKL